MEGHCALGDISVHCSKTWSPCSLALLPWSGGPFPDLSQRGFQPEGFGLPLPTPGDFGLGR